MFFIFYFVVDINECNGEESGHNCDINAACTNTDGGFTCECNDGWSGNGVSCTGNVMHRLNKSEKIEVQSEKGVKVKRCYD